MTCHAAKALLRPLKSKVNYISCHNLSMSTKDKLKTLRQAYGSEGKYQSSSELATHLAKNVLYFEPKDKSGVIIVNKPAGVPLKTYKDDIGLEDAMPELSQILGVEKIAAKNSKREAKIFWQRGSNL